MLIALKVEHAVHHVFQDLWPGYKALFIHMADDKNGDIPLFSQLHKLHGAVLNLADAAGGRIDLLVIQGLNGVHNENVRLFGLNALQHIAQIRLREDEKIFTFCVQTLRPELELVDGFFAGDIENPELLTQSFTDLQHEGGLTDTGSTTHQHQRAFHRTAA